MNLPVSKAPRLILPNLYRFAPNRETLGGVAYLLCHPLGNVLVDCPFWDQVTQDFLRGQGGVKWLFLTQRDAISKAIASLVEEFNTFVIVQEQESYLLPRLKVQTFADNFTFAEGKQLIWTPGYSPGTACLYDPSQEGILFTGRHLLPNQQGQLQPLRTAKTFHWPRQLKSVTKLKRFCRHRALTYICPGAHTGFLRARDWLTPAHPALDNVQTEL